MKIIRLLMLLMLPFSTSIMAQSQESKIQAVFVLKFIENVKWPQDRKDLTVGVVGKSEIFTELEDRLKVRNPNGIVLKKISASEATTCDVVFIPSKENQSVSTISSSVNEKAVLVITESDYSRKGSGISFVEEGGRLHFIINKDLIEAKGLKVSSSLLTLGKQV